MSSLANNRVFFSRLSFSFCIGLSLFIWFDTRSASNKKTETEIDYHVSSVNLGLFDSFSLIHGSIGNTCIGFLSYTKLPLCSYYVLHSFYVYPEYRNKGYGSSLLLYCCKHLDEIGAKKIYIQPGPYELEAGKIVDVINRKEKLEKLVMLYNRAGFSFVHLCTSFLACIVYRILGIEGDYRYLMSKNSN